MGYYIQYVVESSKEANTSKGTSELGEDGGGIVELKRVKDECENNTSDEEVAREAAPKSVVNKEYPKNGNSYNKHKQAEQADGVDRGDVVIIMKGKKWKEGSESDFRKELDKADGLMAITATSSEHEPRDNGDVVIPGELPVAVETDGALAGVFFASFFEAEALSLAAGKGAKDGAKENAGKNENKHILL